MLKINRDDANYLMLELGFSLVENWDEGRLIRRLGQMNRLPLNGPPLESVKLFEAVLYENQCDGDFEIV